MVEENNEGDMRHTKIGRGKQLKLHFSQNCVAGLINAGLRTGAGTRRVVGRFSFC